MSKLNETIVKCKDLLTDIQRLRSDALHAVEIYDLREIEKSVKDVSEALENVKAYNTDQNTDFTELWASRKQEHERLKEAQKSWIQTEIIRMMIDSARVQHTTND